MGVLTPDVDGPVESGASTNKLDFAGLNVDDQYDDLGNDDICNAKEVGQYWQNLLLKLARGHLALRNESGSTITKGQLVTITGIDVTTGRFVIALAQGNDLSKPAHAIVAADIANNANGYGLRHARVSGLNTNAYAAETNLYLSDTPGAMGSAVGTNEQVVAVVKVQDATNGVVEVICGYTHWTNLGSNLNANARVNGRLNSGAVVGTRRGLNFIAGANINIGVADNLASETLDITITATVSGISGSGTTSMVPRFAAGTTLGDSSASDDGTTFSPTKKLAHPKYDVTPTGNSNNLNIGNATYVRFNPNGAYDLTGIAGGANGRIVCFHNVSGYIQTVKHSSGSSTAGNQVICPNFLDYLLMPNGVVYMRYDPTTAFWRIEENTNVASLPRGHIDGLVTTRTSSTKITVAAGACRDSTDKVDIRTSAAFAKVLGNTWAAGDSNNGLDTGSVATSTWYHVYAIRKDSDGTFDVLFSTSATSPTMPSGYTYKRRIWSVYRDSGGNILTYVQVNDECLWSASIVDINSTNPGASAVLNTLTVPTGFQVWAIFQATLQDSAATRYTYLSCPDQSDEAPTLFTSSAPSLQLISTTSVSWSAPVARIRTNTSGQFRSRLAASGANTIFRVFTYGYVDVRGRDS